MSNPISRPVTVRIPRLLALMPTTPNQTPDQRLRLTSRLSDLTSRVVVPASSALIIEMKVPLQGSQASRVSAASRHDDHGVALVPAGVHDDDRAAHRFDGERDPWDGFFSRRTFGMCFVRSTNLAVIERLGLSGFPSRSREWWVRNAELLNPTQQRVERKIRQCFE